MVKIQNNTSEHVWFMNFYLGCDEHYYWHDIAPGQESYFVMNTALDVKCLAIIVGIRGICVCEPYTKSGSLVIHNNHLVANMREEMFGYCESVGTHEFSMLIDIDMICLWKCDFERMAKSAQEKGFAIISFLWIDLAKKPKSRNILVRLISTAGTGFTYVKQRPRTAAFRLSMMKFDPRVNQHVLFMEHKIK
ncbi:hypothetical protein LPJ66_004653 [Kickxella alabastrina]|uniref:Uncharacterized protein n=1 Tax=Kickxella alabastrina TaxID=61397 RepID=A0ACC1IHC8_9FUNG|nr:hypothetical protein LPJ66_004653 [Kickxella alabastrina]